MNPEEDRFLAEASAEEAKQRYPHLSPRRLRELRAKAKLVAQTPESKASPAVAPQGWQAGVELEGDRGWLCSGPTDSPVKDWSKVMLIWNLDPNEFEVVGDVTFKAWNGFIKNKDFDIEATRLYSYKAVIRRKASATLSKDIDWEAWRKVLKRSNLRRPKQKTNAFAYVVLVADPQIGKKGTDEALENWRRGVEHHAARIEAARPGSVVLAFMGDEHEGVVGHYANQAFSVEMNLHDQLLTDFDMRAWTIRELMPLGLTDIVSVISNHGELQRDARKGGEQISNRADNSSTMVTRMVQRLFVNDKMRWHIADGNPNVPLEIAGARLSFSHGHVARGTGKGEMRVRTAIERQILGDPASLGVVDIHFTAHYHHFHCVSDRGRTIFGCPALEAEKSSEYMLDQYGVWSRPGMLGVKVGSILGPGKWSEAEVSP